MSMEILKMELQWLCHSCDAEFPTVEDVEIRYDDNGNIKWKDISFLCPRCTEEFWLDNITGYEVITDDKKPIEVEWICGFCDNYFSTTETKILEDHSVICPKCNEGLWLDSSLDLVFNKEIGEYGYE